MNTNSSTTDTTAREAQIEREQVEQVFLLGGGELHQHSADFPDAEGFDDHRYWYEGVPHYVSQGEIDSMIEEVNAGDTRCMVNPSSWMSARTIVACELYGQAAIPFGWVRLDGFTSSGETGCPCADSIRAYNNGDALRLPFEAGERCPLCDSDSHAELSADADWCGNIYIGEGWREIILVPDERLCAVAEVCEAFGECADQVDILEGVGLEPGSVWVVPPRSVALSWDGKSLGARAIDLNADEGDDSELAEALCDLDKADPAGVATRALLAQAQAEARRMKMASV